jgi:predicted MPP superfamily phosphohydrolase
MYGIQSKYSNFFSLDLTLMILFAFLIFLATINERGSSYAAPLTKVLPNFSFGAVSDWACNSNTITTVDNIASKNPRLVLGVGDYYYSDYNESRSPDCWFKIVKPIEQRLKISIGNHEHDSQSILNFDISHFNLTKQYYSFNYEDVHFVAISTELPAIGIGSEQYSFVDNDLAKASSDPRINWIIVYYHQTSYSSSSLVQPLSTFRDIYHPLFDKYHVDLVLQGHEHNYQRSYPIKYNIRNSTNPLITDTNIHNYTNPQGRIFAIVGTAGAHLFPLFAKAPYIASQYIGHGFLDVTITNNGRIFIANFYANDGSVKDQFTINKSH